MTATREAVDRRGSRPLLGVRRRPGRLALALFRLPLSAYRHGAGGMLGHTFLRFTHTGRSSGRQYQAVAMVLRHDDVSREDVICAAWGPATDWVRNLRMGPATEVQVDHESYTPEHWFLTDQDAFDVATHFRRAHPLRLRLISAILHWGHLEDDDTLREFVRLHPFVGFRPAAMPADRDAVAGVAAG